MRRPGPSSTRSRRRRSARSSAETLRRPVPCSTGGPPNPDSFWLRRSAVLALLDDLRAGGGDWERFCRYADSMMDEKEFFIRKAIGWVLRDTSKKRPDLVRAWVEPRLDVMSGVTRREALKYL